MCLCLYLCAIQTGGLLRCREGYAAEPVRGKLKRSNWRVAEHTKRGASTQEQREVKGAPKKKKPNGQTRRGGKHTRECTRKRKEWYHQNVHTTLGATGNSTMHCRGGKRARMRFFEEESKIRERAGTAKKAAEGPNAGAFSTTPRWEQTTNNYNNKEVNGKRMKTVSGGHAPLDSNTRAPTA